MKVPYLLIWFAEGEAHATGISEPAPAFVHRNRVFRALTEYLGDADYLREKKGRLLGFSYILGTPTEQEQAIHAGLVSKGKSLKLEDGMLMVVLKQVPYEIECVQAAGTVIYRSSTNDFMLAIPDWGFGAFAFKLNTVDAPVVASRLI